MSTISWISNSGGDWSLGANWQGGVVPGAADDVVMNITAAETITVSTTQQARSVAMTDPAATFVVTNAGVLDVTNNVSLVVDSVQIGGEMVSGGTVAFTVGSGISSGPKGSLEAEYLTGQAGTAAVGIGNVTAVPATGAVILDGPVTLAPVAASCFARGTRIGTVTGQRPVEELAVGDTVILASGATAQITWIGHRRIDCGRHPDPRTVYPVRVRQSAFARNLPRRDLLLSPDHAVYADGVLIPIRCLLNGRTIVQEPWDQVEYFHVELPRHDILLAEELLVESYLDTGGRAAFDNNSGVVQLHPSFVSAAWEAHGAAPLMVAGPALDRVARRLNLRARRQAGAKAEIARSGATA